MAETENFALEVIKRIHHELGTENSADKLKLVIKIIAEETRSASADIYVKADDVTLEHIAGFPQNGSRPAVRIGEGVVGKAGADNRTCKNQRGIQNCHAAETLEQTCRRIAGSLSETA